MSVPIINAFRKIALKYCTNLQICFLLYTVQGDLWNVTSHTWSWEMQIQTFSKETLCVTHGYINSSPATSAASPNSRAFYNLPILSLELPGLGADSMCVQIWNLSQQHFQLWLCSTQYIPFFGTFFFHCSHSRIDLFYRNGFICLTE